MIDLIGNAGNTFKDDRFNRECWKSIYPIQFLKCDHINQHKIYFLRSFFKRVENFAESFPWIFGLKRKIITSFD